MRPLNCLIVDDEPLALDLIEGYVKRTPFLHLVKRCNNAFEAIETISDQPVDLVFLDISMPELNGLQLSRTLAKNQKVVFTTAYEKYALEGFKVDALDYLLKPFNYEEFLKAAHKALEWFRMAGQAPAPEEDRTFIFVKSEYKLIKIYLRDILFIEGLKDYIKIHLASQEKAVLTLMSLKSLEQQLPPAQFLRIHRSYIINLECVEFVERNQVIIHKTRITVAGPYREKFQQYIASRSMNS